MFIADEDVAPSEEAEQFAEAPKLAEVEADEAFARSQDALGLCVGHDWD